MKKLHDYGRRFWRVITKLTKDQADYINVDVDGPYKPDYYKY